MSSELVVPSRIPWDSISSKELEEFLFWLIDAMGGKDLVWRIGSSGSGSADGGRDLEAVFYVTKPDDEVVKEKWWFEVKKRTKTVSPSVVKDAVINATAVEGLDCLVIATNSRFSNPTRDWISDWSKLNHTFKVRLWDREKLEKLCSDHPQVVSRLFQGALTSQGKLELAKKQFMNNLVLMNLLELKHIWLKKLELDWDDGSLMTVLVSEIANGDISVRPWANKVANGEALLYCFHAGVINISSVLDKSKLTGFNVILYIKTLSYLMLVILDMIKGRITRKKVEAIFYPGIYGNNILYKELLNIVIDSLENELFDLCMYDCPRIIGELLCLREEEIYAYWDRLGSGQILDEIKEEQEERGFFIELDGQKCKLGYKVSKKRRCPFDIFREKKRGNLSRLIVLRKVMAIKSKARSTRATFHKITDLFPIDNGK